MLPLYPCSIKCLSSYILKLNETVLLSTGLAVSGGGGIKLYSG